jgi:signal transduction histidine kinase
MATIKTLAEMANSDRISKQKRMKNLVMIVREMDRLNDLAYEILDFSKGELNLNLTEVNLEEYISEIELFLRADFQYAGIDCILDIDYKGNILIDRDRMRRVLINLSKNAIEAMYDGKKDYKFIIRVERIPLGGLRISLIDNGPGLSEAVEGRIFEAFATDGKAKGTGLGLFMSKWIVEAHNGSLTYETKHGEGTSFFITLPIAK